jgi:glycosyltransferase involved in cell wall biosynthesis
MEFGHRPLRILTFSSLFPNAAQPNNGIFVENRLRHLVASGHVEARVVAPVPWFPSSNPQFGGWARFAAAPSAEQRHGLEIRHPRYAVLPKLGMSLAPMLMYLGTHSSVRRWRAGNDFDLIDAHYFYPDGVAAALIAHQLNKPLVITARGSDLNLIPQFTLPRAQIRWAAGVAAGIITVCEALKQPLLDMGVPADKIQVLRNGVDLISFHPHDRAAARAKLGVSGPVLLSVGLLIERKGHALVIEALRQLPDMTLLIAGDGPDRTDLETKARGAGVADRVRFLGEVSHHTLPEIYSAADALVLASSREGWANVLLEAMACGTPVVASDVWGTKEAVTAPEAGILMRERSADGVAEGIRRLFAALPVRMDTRRYAEQYSWETTTQGQLDMFQHILKLRPGPRPRLRAVES